MLLKSKSVITVIGLGLFALVCIVAGALLMNRADITEFSNDGYILTASAEEGSENVMVSEQIWFGQGSSWKEGKEEVRFTDAQGDAVQVPSDSFIHYSDNSITSVKDISVMSLDEYAQGKIQYYVLKQGVPLTWDGSNYILGEGADAVSFRSFLMKSSDEHYLLGGESMNLLQGNGKAAHVEGGYLELQYMADDKSVALLNDGTDAWQILTEGASIELSDGTSLNLSKGELAQSTTPEIQTVSGFYIDDIDITTSRKNIWYNQNGYPVYRFTVLNGEDGENGQDGAAGEDGETGEEGEEGEQGTEGSSSQSGEAGGSGNSGGAGTVGAAGAGGGQMSGVSVSTSIPVVTITKWSVNGKQLQFTVYTDEVSCNSIVEKTTVIKLTDNNTGKVVYGWDSDDSWNTGQDPIDLSDDNEEGFSLYCGVLEAGHRYTLTVEAEYNVNDATGKQVLLTRSFTADDYGVSFELTDRSSDSVTFSMKKTNQLVTVDSVDVYVDGIQYGTMQAEDFDSYTISFKDWAPEHGKDHANRTHEISFRPQFEVSSFDANGDSTTTPVSGVQYDYTVTTLKNGPSVGGIRLTAYDSGYLMAEVLGEYTGNKYGDASDPDDTIKNIRFELYRDASMSGEPVAVQESSSGYLAYFTVSEDSNAPVQVGKTYFVRAYYTYNDGSRELTLPVPETKPGLSNYGNYAIDSVTSTRLTTTTLSFEGDSDVYNTDTELIQGSNKGLTFNRISGYIVAELSGNNPYVISSDHPLELHVSGSPDYYRSFQYGAVDKTSHILSAVDTSQSQGETSLDIGKVKMLMDLTGLRAGTSYMFTLYGYQKNDSGSYNRVTMGSFAVQTRSEKTMYLKLQSDPTVVDGIGVNLTLGNPESTNAYSGGTYNEETYKRISEAFKSLYSITFELYREGTETPLGTCKIVDENKTDVSHNTLYEKFYGKNAAETLKTYKAQGYKGIIGVGKVNYPYYFVDASGVELNAGTLTGGKYYVKATEVYDYTWMRYHDDDRDNQYGYYTYKSDESNYINQMGIAENEYSSEESDRIESMALPYPEPDELKYSDNTYIKVTPLTNDKLGAYNADPDQNRLYSENWDADTVAGLELSTNYLNDADCTTSQLYFYGYTYDTWKKMTDQDQPTKPKDGKDQYTIKCTLDLGINDKQIVPKVWLLFYRSADLPNISAAANDPDSGISQAGNSGSEVGCLFRKTAKVNGEDVEIFYMDEKYFSRGQSYVFAFETKLSQDYTYKDVNGVTRTGFNYPEDYYLYMKNSTPYKKSNTLASGTVSVKRQIPKVYAALQKTEIEKTTDNNTGKDTWKVFVNDPDGAIHWNSMLTAAKDNHLPDGGSAATNKGGIYDLYGGSIASPLSGSGEDAKYLTFGFAGAGTTGKTLNTATIYNPDDKDNPLEPELAKNSLKATELDDIKTQLAKITTDRDGNITDRGGTVTVTNLPSAGLSYKLTVDYLLLDDIAFSPSTSYSNLPILQHNYIGINDYTKDEDKLTLTDAEAADDRSTMYIYLNPSQNALNSDTELNANCQSGSYKDDYYLTKDYLNKARTIAAVSMQVKNGGTYIKERDKDGKLTSKTKTLWLYPEAPGSSATDYRYYLKFKMSDVDQTTGDDLQYSAGANLTYELTVYYLTGAGGIQSTDYMSSDFYALKSVKAISNVSNLYGSDRSVDQASYRFTTNTTISDSFSGAGRSFYSMKAALKTEGTVPWTQQFTITSGGFDTKCKEQALQTVTLESVTNSTTREGLSDSVMEAMKLESYKVDEKSFTVESPAPSLQNAKTSHGIVQINLKADIENWNLVKYPEGEDLHLYYMIYTYETDNVTGVATKKDLAGVLVGDSLAASGGKLDQTFPFVFQGRKYWIEVYYKEESAKKDTDLFNGITYDPGKLYLTPVAGGTSLDQTDPNSDKGSVARQLADVINTNSTFKKISGIGERLLEKTGEGLEMSGVTLNLDTAKGYREKKLDVVTTITSDILDTEKESLEIFYRLERRSEGETGEADWKTVIAEEADKDNITNWCENPTDENYWNYYESDVGDITLLPAAVTKGTNEMMFPYYAGGLIRPGYSYRIKAGIYQRQTGDTYRLVSKKIADKQPDGFCVSEPQTWKSQSLDTDQQALIQTGNVIRGSKTIKLDYKVTDINGTSLDGKYFVRLAEKQEDGTYKVLEDGPDSAYYYSDTSGSWMNKAYDMGTSYQKVSYGDSTKGLTPGKTYRLQFYAMMDLEFDNHLNYTSSNESGLLTAQHAQDIMKCSDYYPRSVHTNIKNIEDISSTLYETMYNGMKSYTNVPSSLKLDYFAKDTDETTKSLLIGYSDDITTLAESMTASAGEYQETVIGGANQITVKFKGAYNAGDISRIEYSLEKDGGTTSWQSVILDKKDADTSLFDRTGSGSRNDGVEGKISLSLALGDPKDNTSMNVKATGKYYLTVRMYRYDQQNKSYVWLQTYDIPFYNNTAWQ